MAEFATTRMSSKGQVVIPEAIRKRLGLEAGSQFVVVAGKDAVIIGNVQSPSLLNIRYRMLRNHAAMHECIP